jgi:hypothetical protein
MSFTLTIEGHLYEIHNFSHPGEGIRDVWLKNYAGKNVSEEFDYYHMTNEPWEILEKARELGEYKGIVYKGEEKSAGEINP